MTNFNLSDNDKMIFAQINTAMRGMTPEGQHAVGLIYAQALNNTNQGDVNMNNQNNQQPTQKVVVDTENVTISKADFDRLLLEVQTLKQQVQTGTTSHVQQPNIQNSNNTNPRIIEIEKELTKLMMMFENDEANNVESPNFAILRYKALNKEYRELLGMDFNTRLETVVGTGINKITNLADMIGAYGQDRIANDIIPTTFNNTSDFLSEVINLAGGAVVSTLGIVHDAVGGLVQGGTQITSTVVSKGGEATSKLLSNTTNSAFGLFRKRGI